MAEGSSIRAQGSRFTGSGASLPDLENLITLKKVKGDVRREGGGRPQGV